MNSQHIALACASRGWRVHPVHIVYHSGGKTDKKPLTRWNIEASTDPKKIEAWWAEYDFLFVGALTGQQSGLYVVDVDDPAALTAAGLDLGAGIPVPTNRPGGMHYYFGPPADGREVRNSAADGLDFRGDGGWIMSWGLPPEGELAPLPPEVAEFFRARGQRRRVDEDEPEDDTPIPEGARDNTLFRKGCQMRRSGFSEEEILAALIVVNARRCIPPLEQEDLERIAHSAANYKPARDTSDIEAALASRKKAKTGVLSEGATPSAGQSTGAPTRTDAGNTQRFVARYGDCVRYVAQWKEWLIWDGSRWEPDTLGWVYELAKETAFSIYAEAQECTDEDKRKALGRWAAASQNLSRIKAMVQLATTDPAVAVDAEMLDTNIWLLNCTNGTLDLRTGELRAPDKEDLITKTTRVAYDPDAECPRFLGFISWAMDEREELVGFLQRALGYSLSGSVSERVVFLLYGEGRNGKSTLLKTVRRVLGDYAKRVASDTFARARGGNGNSATPNQAQLKGLRFVCTSEMEEGTQLATAMLKDFTGDETVSARRLYRDPFEFMPEFKPWIAANHKPVVSGTDQAIWDRMRLVPFDVRISEDERDEQLGEKLWEEAEGILAWMVEGCRKWLGVVPGAAKGLSFPTAVQEANEAYREEMDPFMDFLEDLGEVRGEFDDEGNFIEEPVDMRRQPVHDKYLSWARRRGAPMLSARQFKARMEEAGYAVRGADHHWELTPEAARQKRNALGAAIAAYKPQRG